MSAAGGRDAILGSIRRSLGRGPLDEAARAAVDERIAQPKPNIVPERTDIPQDERVELFTSMAEAVFATVDRVTGADAVPGAVADYLAQHNLPAVAGDGARSHARRLSLGRAAHARNPPGQGGGG